MAGGVFDPAKPDPDQDQDQEKRKEKKRGERGGGEEKDNKEKELEKERSLQPASSPFSLPYLSFSVLHCDSCLANC